MEENSFQIKGANPFFFNNDSKIGVLLLHGFTSTPFQFRELAKYLTDRGLTVYAPLIAGHGTSPEDLIGTNPEDWKRSAERAYSKLKEKVDKIIIIGNSFGGNLAFYLAKKKDPLAVISLGTPIKLRFELFIKLRLYLYGWAKKYYRKAKRHYKIDYTDMQDEVTYPVIPIKSLRDFLSFLEKETIPNLDKVKIPTLIIHANTDFVVSPKSATYIHQNIGSFHKEIYWFGSNHHVVMNDEKRDQLFERIYKFIEEVT